MSWYRCRTPNGRSLAEATPQEVIQLEQLNSIFADLQVQTTAKIVKIKTEMDEKINDRNSFIDDYEIETSINCILGENDPLFLDDDNFISILQNPIFLISPEDANSILDYTDCNILAHLPDHPLYGQKHCCFFHEILDHLDPPLSLDDVLRIAEVWIDINVYHRKFQQTSRLKA